MEFIDEEIDKLEKELKYLKNTKEERLSDKYNHYIGYCFTFGNECYYKIIDSYYNKGNLTFTVTIIDNQIFEIIREDLMDIQINDNDHEGHVTLDSIINGCINPEIFEEQVKYCCNKIINSLK